MIEVSDWAAIGFVETEKPYGRIMGYQQLWMLEATLDDLFEDGALADKRKAGQRDSRGTVAQLSTTGGTSSGSRRSAIR